MQKHIDELATSPSADGVVLYLGNYITEFGVVKRLMNRAKDDTRLVIHNVPVINDRLQTTWPAKYALNGRRGRADGKGIARR